MLSEFITITKKGSYLELQFSSNEKFIKYIKGKIYYKFCNFIYKESYEKYSELEREIVCYHIHKMYWKRIANTLQNYFKKIYIIKGSSTFTVCNNKVIKIKQVVKDDKENYEKDYMKKKYKVYRDR